MTAGGGLLLSYSIHFPNCFFQTTRVPDNAAPCIAADFLSRLGCFIQDDCAEAPQTLSTRRKRYGAASQRRQAQEAEIRGCK